MRDEQTNTREPMTCTWVAVTGSDGRTRLEVRQWLPAHVTGATEEGWRQSFAQLDAHLATAAASRAGGLSR